MSELLPCPFSHCDGAVELRHAEHQYWVECLSCGAHGGIFTRPEIAIEWWNTVTRAQPIAPAPGVDEAGRTDTERALLHAISVCKSKRLSFKNAAYLAAIDEVQISLEAALERVQNGEQMEAVAIASAAMNPESEAKK